MQQHMQKMQETMRALHNTEDPAERQRLMQQHRQQMHETMSSMCAMMGNGDKHHKMKDMTPDERQQMMREHMQTMQGTMEQMKEHMKADQRTEQDQ